MLKPGGHSNLALEPFGSQSSRQVGPQHLECYLALMPEILGEIHGSHPAPAKPPLDVICGADKGLKTLQWIFHREPRGGDPEAYGSGRR